MNRSLLDICSDSRSFSYPLELWWGLPCVWGDGRRGSPSVLLGEGERYKSVNVDTYEIDILSKTFIFQ